MTAADRATPAHSDDPAAEVTRRVAEFARTGVPSVLWPGLTEASRMAAAREIERVTRELLAGASTAAFDPAFDAFALGIAGHTTGMGPLVGHWIEQGTVQAIPTVAEVFARHLDHGRRRAARIERESAPALEALQAAGVPVVALKGLHTGHVYFDEPGARRLADVDILIPADRVVDAESALAAAGFRPTGPVHRPYKRDWIGAAVDPRFYSVELTDACTGWSIEVHASLDRVYHPGAVARLDVLRGATEPLTLNGYTLHVLVPPLLVLYLACHCSQELDSIRLLRVYELVRVIRTERDAGRLDWNDVLTCLEQSASAQFVFPAVALVEELAPGTIDARLLARARAAAGWSARHTVARLAPAGGSLDERGILRQLMWTRTPTAMALRFFRTLWPASIARPGDVLPAWKTRLRRLRSGALSLRAPDERAQRRRGN